MAKKIKGMSYNKCPECGKDVLTRFMNEQVFCDDICRRNYKYKEKYKKPFNL